MLSDASSHFGYGAAQGQSTCRFDQERLGRRRVGRSPPGQRSSGMVRDLITSCPRSFMTCLTGTCSGRASRLETRRAVLSLTQEKRQTTTCPCALLPCDVLWSRGGGPHPLPWMAGFVRAYAFRARKMGRRHLRWNCRTGVPPVAFGCLGPNVPGRGSCVRARA